MDDGLGYFYGLVDKVVPPTESRNALEAHFCREVADVAKQNLYIYIFIYIIFVCQGGKFRARSSARKYPPHGPAAHATWQT